MSDPQRQLGERYELLVRLSAGPGGAMWCGRDLRTGSGCAIRVLEPGFTADPAGGGELPGALALVRQLAHPAIIAVEDVVNREGGTALVMRLVSGESLAVRLARLGQLDPVEAMSLIAQLCDALSAAHAAGLAHGRVKPSNIMLEPGADALLTVKLTDFGMAALQIPGVNDAPPTAAAAISAAVYRAPELDVATPATTAADLYATGVVLYEALAGYPPFTGAHAEDIAALHREAPPPRIPGLPDAIWPLLTACLAKQPHLRPSADVLAGVLRDFAPSVPASDEPVRATATAPAPAEPQLLEEQQPTADPTAAPAPAALTHHSLRRARRAELAAAVGVAALAGAIAYFVNSALLSHPPAVGSSTRSAIGNPTTAATAPSSGRDTAGSSPATSVTSSALPALSASAPVIATSTTTSPATRLPIADPIGFLQGLRAQIQALVAQGRSTIDPAAAGDLQNLVIDLENSVTSYQRNGGTAHLQEIKNKIAAFDTRLATLVNQGRISQSAANQLAAYLQQLPPPDGARQG
jgi:serine/threonine protein kinase, bacterial